MVCVNHNFSKTYLKYGYILPGCPTNYEDIAVAQRKDYHISGFFLAGETNVCCFVFLHGGPIYGVGSSANTQIRVIK